MKNALSAEEAIALLRERPDAYRSGEDLRALAAQVDANASGRVTVLYSGPAAKGIWSTDVIAAMVEMGEDVRVINCCLKLGIIHQAQRRLNNACRYIQSRSFSWMVGGSVDERCSRIPSGNGLPGRSSISPGVRRGRNLCRMRLCWILMYLLRLSNPLLIGKPLTW